MIRLNDICLEILKFIFPLIKSVVVLLYDIQFLVLCVTLEFGLMNDDRFLIWVLK